MIPCNAGTASFDIIETAAAAVRHFSSSSIINIGTDRAAEKFIFLQKIYDWRTRKFTINCSYHFFSCMSVTFYVCMPVGLFFWRSLFISVCISACLSLCMAVGRMPKWQFTVCCCISDFLKIKRFNKQAHHLDKRPFFWCPGDRPLCDLRFMFFQWQENKK